MAVIITDQGSTLRIVSPVGQNDVYKSKINCSTDAIGNIIIQWDKANYASYYFADITSPSGANPALVQQQIAAMLYIH